jgi:hypothetical protein
MLAGAAVDLMKQAMEPEETMLVSGRIVAEFADDASKFLDGAAEFARVAELPGVMTEPNSILPTNALSHGKPN